MVRIKRFLFFAALFIVSNLSAQSVSVSAYSDSSHYLVGDYIRYNVDVTYPEGTAIYTPELPDSIANLELIKTEPVREGTEGKLKNKIFTYIFSAYDSAGITIPPARIGFKHREDSEKNYIETNPVFLTVTPMEVNPAEDIMDVKSPIKMPPDWVFISIIALILLALIIGAYFGLRYYRKKKTPAEREKVTIRIPPGKEALSALYRLEEKKLWQQGKIKEYHSEITSIIRTYFERRFDFPAMEMPSSEIIGRLKDIDETGAVFDNTVKFFENADLVKFAKFEPLPSVNEEMMKQAKEIVKVTRKEDQPEVKEDV